MATPFSTRRFIEDPVIIKQVLDRCKIIHIGLQDTNRIYVVPTNYGYTYENGHITFYTHGATQGLKWELMQKHPNVGFEIDTGFELVDGGEVACNYSNAYASIIGSGTASLITDIEEKKRIINNIMMVQAGKSFTFTDAMVERLGIAKIEVEEFACKSGYLYEK